MKLRLVWLCSLLAAAVLLIGAAQPRKSSGLIVHECDKRRDDEGGASTGNGRELVAEALACSCGHDQQNVAAFGGGSADGLLIGAEGGEAEGLVEEVGEVHELAYLRILFACGVSGRGAENT